MPEIIIVDTSVLIALDKLNILSLLCNIYSELWIPEAVNKEFGPIVLPCVSIKKTKNKLIKLLTKDLNLGLGEAEAIALANENNMNVMIDDMKARKIAQDLGLSVTGTIGFLLKAYQLNLIKSAYEKAQELRKLGFYISDQLLDEIQQLELKKQSKKEL